MTALAETTISKEELVQLGALVEKASYYPRGRIVDGSPYGAGPEARRFLNLAIDHFGGFLKVRKMVEKRKQAEPLADHDCTNWILWTLLLELGVACEQS